MASNIFGVLKKTPNYHTVGDYPAYVGTSKFGQEVGGNVRQGMSGQGSTGLRAGITYGDNALARAAQSARAQVGAQVGATGLLGQGRANRVAQGAEQSILDQIAQKKAQDAQALSNEQMQYTQMGADMLRQQAGLDANISAQDKSMMLNLFKDNPVAMAKLQAEMLRGYNIPWSEAEDLENQAYLKDMRESLAAQNIDAAQKGVSDFYSNENKSRLEKLLEDALTLPQQKQGDNERSLFDRTGTAVYKASPFGVADEIVSGSGPWYKRLGRGVWNATPMGIIGNIFG